MSRTPITVAAATLAALGAGAALAAAGQPAAAPASAKTLRLVATPKGGSGLDLGRKGPSVGDEFFEHGRLRDAAGHAAGTFQLVTQLVAGNGRHGSEHNSLALRMPGGTLETDGTHPTADRYRVPVTGGTGTYAGAGGVLSAAPAGHGRVRVTVRLGR